MTGFKVNNKTPEIQTAAEVRKELGAVWSKVAKDNSQYLSIKLQVTKQMLEELAASANNNEVTLNLVAFTNRYKDGNDRRPDFRIFEEKK